MSTLTGWSDWSISPDGTIMSDPFLFFASHLVAPVSITWQWLVMFLCAIWDLIHAAL